MRFLCLHGSGTSGAIFAAQTAAFRHRLQPTHHTFAFPDGPHPTTPGPGVQPFFEPPYYTFLTHFDPCSIAHINTWLETLFSQQTEEPYDAVLGFSQGASVLAGFTVWHRLHRPGSPLPYKAAMFICGGAPLPALEAMGFAVSEEARVYNERATRRLWAAAGNIEAIIAESRDAGVWDTSAHDLQVRSEDKWSLPPVDLSNVFGLNLSNVPEHFRIKIPTVHVYGAKDPRTTAAIQLALLCDAETRLTYDHGGGHEIPRKSNISDDLAAMVEWLERKVEAADGSG